MSDWERDNIVEFNTCWIVCLSVHIDLVEFALAIRMLSICGFVAFLHVYSTSIYDNGWFWRAKCTPIEFWLLQAYTFDFRNSHKYSIDGKLTLNGNSKSINRLDSMRAKRDNVRINVIHSFDSNEYVMDTLIVWHLRDYFCFFLPFFVNSMCCYVRLRSLLCFSK